MAKYLNPSAPYEEIDRLLNQTTRADLPDLKTGGAFDSLMLEILVFTSPGQTATCYESIKGS